MPLDPVDLRILRALRLDSKINLAALSSMVGLSSTPCWRRIQRMKEDGYVEREVAILNAQLLDLPALVFIQVRLSMAGKSKLEEFQAAVIKVDEVQECFTVMGSFDYLLKVVVGSTKDYERFFLEKLSTLPGIEEVRSAMVLSVCKSTTALPI